MKRNMRWIRNRRGGIFLWILAFLFAFDMVFENISITNLRYKITALEDNLKREKTKGLSLAIEIAELSSPERIEALASSYGFISIPPSSIVFMEDVEEAPLESENKEERSFFAKLLSNVFAIQIK